MQKIFAVILMIVMMLGGCGVAKNLRKTASKPAPTPEAHKDVWDGHHVPEEALTFRQYVYVGTEFLLSIGFLCFIHFC
jgi:hypothetical protein